MIHPVRIVSSEDDLLTSSYSYTLPKEYIASRPSDVRDAARLMVMHAHAAPEHRVFSDLPEYLRPGDCLVINDTRVIPARLHGKRSGTGGHVEFLLLRCLAGSTWQVLVKPGKNAAKGQRVIFSDGELEAVVDDVEPDGTRVATFSHEGDFFDLISRIGEMPLPPYIHEKLNDPERYQTVYSEVPGSAAAPTAGLHFTKQLLERVSAMGVDIVRVTLHVGLGTFRPVKEEKIAEHAMHSEYFVFDEKAARVITKTKQAGNRVIAVGTTSCRVLESVALLQHFGDESINVMKPYSGETSLYIYPGFRFRVIDAMITNFHLPESTLLMLVSALMGREKMLDAYREAVKEKYRFFSFGDAMLLLPELSGADGRGRKERANDRGDV